MSFFQRPRHAFTRLGIAKAPAEQGVFCLWEGDEVIYIGRATGNATIKSCLDNHYAGDYGACTQGATQYTWEASLYPASRQAELLEEFTSVHRRPPRCHGGRGTVDGK
jgi:hypothetical protein